MPYVATQASPPGKLYARGFHFTRDLLRADPRLTPLYDECGALQLPATKRLARILNESTQFVEGIPMHRISAQEATERAGVTIPTPSFFMPHGGFCQPREITSLLVQTTSTEIDVRCSLEATSLHAEDDVWRVHFNTGDGAASKIVILCGAHEITKLQQSAWIPLEPIRGQTAQVTGTTESLSLKVVISHAGYLTPAYEGLHFVGGHYRHNDMNETPMESDTDEILARLYPTLPSIHHLKASSSRVCFRASTHDRLPYIGELPIDTTPPLYINAGHGSRGLITAPMGGEIVARLIHHEPLGDLAEASSVTSAGRLAKRLF